MFRIDRGARDQILQTHGEDRDHLDKGNHSNVSAVTPTQRATQELALID